MLRLLFFIFFSLSFSSVTALAMTGCGDGSSCKDCHSLTTQEAKEILGEQVDKVNKVEFSEVPGLWLLEVERKGQMFPLFLDFSKKYVASGNIFKLANGKNITAEKQRTLTRIPISSIPLDDAIIYGDTEAAIKVVVITDPECPYCSYLHKEIKEVLEMRPDIVFYVKLYPLKIHPKAYDKAKSIVCTKSHKMLDDSLDGKPVPPPLCETDAIDKNIDFMKANGIRSTPTVILPDGFISPGYKKADKLIEQIDLHLIK